MINPWLSVCYEHSRSNIFSLSEKNNWNANDNRGEENVEEKRGDEECVREMLRREREIIVREKIQEGMKIKNEYEI